MPAIRNLQLIKKFTDFLQLKHTDMLDSEAGKMLIPVVSVPILPTRVQFTPTEAELATGIRVPAGVKWKLKSIFVRWTSDVNAGNREIRIVINNPDTGNGIFINRSRNFQAASLVIDYNFFVGANDVGSASGGSQVISIPDINLVEGTRITVTDFAVISAGDTATLSTFVVEEETLTEIEAVDR